MDVAVKVMVAVVDVGMIMVVVVTCIGAAGMDQNDSGQGNEMAGKGNVAGVDCGAQHGHGFGRGAYLH